jgi:hypothetical protein
MVSAVPERLAVARIPQARPSEPAVTGSIKRQQHASYSQKRFRRLREMPMPFRNRRRYSEPDYQYPAPPPFFYYR